MNRASQQIDHDARSHANIDVKVNLLRRHRWHAKALGLDSCVGGMRTQCCEVSETGKIGFSKPFFEEFPCKLRSRLEKILKRSREPWCTAGQFARTVRWISVDRCNINH